METPARHGFPVAEPAPELIAAGFAYETDGAAMLHRGLNLADMAHVLDLAERELIPQDARRALLAELLAADATAPEAFGYDPRDGEPYNSRERVFAAAVGDAAGWLHAGRPRREATRVAFRLHLRRAVGALASASVDLARALQRRASEERGTLFADQTYLQHAQPSTVGHYLLSFAYPVLRDARRLLDVLAWINTSPAGAGCVNGTRLTDDRRSIATALGFREVITNTRDAMWQVDGLIQLAAVLSSLACTQCSLAEDLEIWASAEFDYVDLAEEFTRASVLMPNKRNPYSLSIIRGTTGVVIGQVTGLLAVQKSPSARSDALIFAYGELPVAVERTRRITELTRGVVETLDVHAERMRAALEQGFSQATDLAEIIMLNAHIDYRSAYRVVGRAVRTLSARGLAARDLSVAGLQEAAVAELGAPLAVDGDALADALDPAAIVATREAAGGAAAGPMQAMLADVAGQAGELEAQIRAALDHIDAAEGALCDRAARFAAE
jgi:argininosuccinate lyase